MSKIVQLDPTYDIWLSYTWSNNNHGICGHTFEVFDYFYILSKHFKVGILIGEDIDWNILQASIRSKYKFTEEEIQHIKNSTVFHNRPRLIKGQNILFVDGGVVNAREYHLMFNNVLFFACGNKEIKDNTNDRVWILQDDRVYESVQKNGINYKKRILFSKLKEVGHSTTQALVYATKNCRDIRSYEGLRQYSDHILVITNKENKHTPLDGFTFVTPPVEDLFAQFSTYIYTPIARKWDCSPRFLAECKYYNKNVIFHDIDYWDIDKGLYWRNWDIENNFESLFLTDDDEIIKIITNIIK